MPCTGGQQRIFAVSLDIPGRDSRQIVVCAGVFLLPGGIFAMLFRCPAQGGIRGFLQCL